MPAVNKEICVQRERGASLTAQILPCALDWWRDRAEVRAMIQRDHERDRNNWCHIWLRGVPEIFSPDIPGLHMTWFFAGRGILPPTSRAGDLADSVKAPSYLRANTFRIGAQYRNESIKREWRKTLLNGYIVTFVK